MKIIITNYKYLSIYVVISRKITFQRHRTLLTQTRSLDKHTHLPKMQTFTKKFPTFEPIEIFEFFKQHLSNSKFKKRIVTKNSTLRVEAKVRECRWARKSPHEIEGDCELSPREITLSCDDLRPSAANFTRVCMTAFALRCVYYFTR